jgi:hypothetical protein
MRVSPRVEELVADAQAVLDRVGEGDVQGALARLTMLRLDCNAAAAELDRLLQLERRAYMQG